jgi:hypothetical protein
MVTPTYGVRYCVKRSIVDDSILAVAVGISSIGRLRRVSPIDSGLFLSKRVTSLQSGAQRGPNVAEGAELARSRPYRLGCDSIGFAMVTLIIDRDRTRSTFVRVLRDGLA